MYYIIVPSCETTPNQTWVIEQDDTVLAVVPFC